MALPHAGRVSDSLSAVVAVEGLDEVQSYLDTHLDMIDVTRLICRAARQAFGSEAGLTLKVYHDPEIDDSYLLLRVRLPSYAPDTLQRIRALTDPYETELSEKSGAILVTTDFCPML